MKVTEVSVWGVRNPICLGYRIYMGIYSTKKAHKGSTLCHLSDVVAYDAAVATDGP
jgi:hypothetical protein